MNAGEYAGSYIDESRSLSIPIFKTDRGTLRAMWQGRNVEHVDANGIHALLRALVEQPAAQNAERERALDVLAETPVDIDRVLSQCVNKVVTVRTRGGCLRIRGRLNYNGGDIGAFDVHCGNALKDGSYSAAATFDTVDVVMVEGEHWGVTHYDHVLITLY